MFLIKIVPQYNSLTYPVFPTTPAGRSLPANKLCCICCIRAAGFVRFPISCGQQRWWRVFGRAGRLKNRRLNIYNYSTLSDGLCPLSQKEAVIGHFAAQELGIKLHQDFVKLQNLVLHFAAFGYR